MKETIKLILLLLSTLSFALALIAPGVLKIFGPPFGLRSGVWKVIEDFTPWLLGGAIVVMLVVMLVVKLIELTDEDTGATAGAASADEDTDATAVAFAYISGMVCFFSFTGAYILSYFGVFRFGVPDLWKDVIKISGFVFIVSVVLILILSIKDGQKSE